MVDEDHIKDIRAENNPLVGFKERYRYGFVDQRSILDFTFPLTEAQAREIEMCGYEMKLFGMTSPRLPRWEKKIEYLLSKQGVKIPKGMIFRTFWKNIEPLLEAGITSVQAASSRASYGVDL
jgi:hypothetical protein